MAYIVTVNGSPDLKLKNKNKSKRKTRDPKYLLNLLKMKPVRIHKWKSKPDDPDVITIKMPRFQSNFGKRFGKLFKLKPTYNINLEKYGSAVWRLCNGKVTVEEIGEVLREQFGDEVEPIYERLAEYLTFLERNKLIKYEKYVITRRFQKGIQKD